MTDILIRNVPDSVLERIDARAAASGVSRTEFLRRQIEQIAGRSPEPATLDDFAKFSRIGDPEWMEGAWS
ncbi:MAG: ribbon-helix-helix domain-containing protein [Gordonia amarae]